jgi:hypothetical protein
MEGVSKRYKIHVELKERDCSFDDFTNAITKAFQYYFTNSKDLLLSILIDINEQTIWLCNYKRPKEVLKLLRTTIVSEMKFHNSFIGVSPRYISSLRPLYWKHYLIVRKLGFPIDVVWMILERVGITVSVTKDNICKAAMMCLRHCRYLNKTYLPRRRTFSRKSRIHYIWGEELVQKLYLEI